jgi:hypothetical protein
MLALIGSENGEYFGELYSTSLKLAFNLANFCIFSSELPRKKWGFIL